jgi:hypothetical protein
MATSRQELKELSRDSDIYARIISEPYVKESGRVVANISALELESRRQADQIRSKHKPSKRKAVKDDA